MKTENNNKEIQNLNDDNLNLLADVACKELLYSKYDEIKEFVFTKINKLKEYAIYYNKNIKNLDIKEINNLIEIELSKNEEFTLLKI